MTADSKMRIAVYPVVLVLLAGLAYGGFVYKADPDVGTLVNSAEILAQAGLFDEAIANAERALEQTPDERYAHVILGYSYGMKGDYERSLGHYDRAIAATPTTDPSHSLLRLYRAEMLCEAGRPADARKAAEAVLADAPTQHQAWFVIGRSRRMEGDLEAAAKAYALWSEAAPDDAMALVLRADVEEERENLAGARDLLGRAVGLKPQDARLAMRKAKVHEVLGERDQAVAETLRAAELSRSATAKWLAEEEATEALRADPRLAGIDGKEEGDRNPLK